MMVVIYGRYACAWRHGKSEPFQMTREMQSCIVADHYLPLPSKFDIHGYGIMERFCYAIEDDDIGDALCRAIRGRGAFRYVKDKIHEYGIADDWYTYRDEALREMVINWREANEIRYAE